MEAVRRGPRQLLVPREALGVYLVKCAGGEREEPV